MYITDEGKIWEVFKVINLQPNQNEATVEEIDNPKIKRTLSRKARKMINKGYIDSLYHLW